MACRGCTHLQPRLACEDCAAVRAAAPVVHTHDLELPEEEQRALVEQPSVVARERRRAAAEREVHERPSAHGRFLG